MTDSVAAIAAGYASGAEGLVSCALDRALKVSVVHGDTEVVALLLREGPVRQRVCDFTDAPEPLRL